MTYIGSKKDNNCVTKLGCCSSDGIQEFLVMIFWMSSRPHCFIKAKGQDIGFDYHYNKKAWTNAVLF